MCVRACVVRAAADLYLRTKCLQKLTAAVVVALILLYRSGYRGWRWRRRRSSQCSLFSSPSLSISLDFPREDFGAFNKHKEGPPYSRGCRRKRERLAQREREREAHTHTLLSYQQSAMIALGRERERDPSNMPVVVGLSSIQCVCVYTRLC